MIEQPNRDHQCRTCGHWGAPYDGSCSGKYDCECPVPFFIVDL